MEGEGGFGYDLTSFPVQKRPNRGKKEKDEIKYVVQCSDTDMAGTSGLCRVHFLKI